MVLISGLETGNVKWEQVGPFRHFSSLATADSSFYTSDKCIMSPISKTHFRISFYPYSWLYIFFFSFIYFLNFIFSFSFYSVLFLASTQLFSFFNDIVNFQQISFLSKNAHTEIKKNKLVAKT